METLSLLQALYAKKPLVIFEIVVDSLKKFCQSTIELLIILDTMMPM